MSQKKTHDLIRRIRDGQAAPVPADAPATIMLCGPGNLICRCRCPDGPCEHVWDGPGETDGHMSSATCSRCGKSALSHSLWVGP